MWFSMKLCKVTWRKNDDVVRQKVEYLCTEAEFDKESFASNQKSLPLPVQKLWPIIWFLTKVVTLTLRFYPIFKKKSSALSCV